MAGQVWQTDALGGYMYADNLSRKLRTALQPMTRFRQFCDVKEAFGTGKGEFFNWDVYLDVADQGGEILETETMPETNFTVVQATLTVTEFGNSVPFTKKLDDLSEHPVTEIIHKVLKNDARKALDMAAYAQFDNCLLRVTPTSGNDPQALDLNVNGTAPGTNNIAFGNLHAKSVADIMAEREIPTFDGQNYFGIGRPTTFRDFKDDLESIHQYVSEGWHVVMNGEKGRYEGIRFVEQTNIASQGWTNGLSDEIFFFGADTVAEAFSIPEEIRGKIPGDYGRSRGVAWYALLGYGIVHTEATQSRIIKWDSAA